MLRASDFENKMLKAYIQDWPEDAPSEDKVNLIGMNILSLMMMVIHLLA